MGRGRAKAKQTRVARELKYHSPNTDLAALQRELAGSSRNSSDDLVDEAGHPTRAALDRVLAFFAERLRDEARGGSRVPEAQ